VNIIEAVKLGTWIRRESKKSMSFRFGINDEVIEFTRDDILADDWEVEPASVTITREQFDTAWHNAFTSNEPYGSLSRDELAKELGL
jgi:hypothetical protein